MSYVRSSPGTLLPKPLDNLEDFLPPRTRIDLPPAQAHADLLVRVGHQQPLQQQMPHVQTHKHPAVVAVFLDWRVVQMHEPDRPVEQRAQLHRHLVRLHAVARRERVVVERDPVDDGDQQQGPVRAAFSFEDVAAVVDGEEDVRRAGEVGQGVADGAGVGGL